jgi:hypothetical protein
MASRPTNAPVDPPADAYTTFVNSIEDDLGSDVFPDDE